MAENDILVPRENAAGGFDERVLTAADIGAVASNDARLTDARTPTAHASTHHTGGSDAIAPNNIGAAWALVLSNQAITGNTLLAAGRNRRISIGSTSAVTANVDLPHENNQAGDIVTLVGVIIGPPVIGTYTIRAAAQMAGSPSAPIAYSTLATLNASGQSFTFISDGTATGWSLLPVNTHTHAAADITSGVLDYARQATIDLVPIDGDDVIINAQNYTQNGNLIAHLRLRADIADGVANVVLPTLTDTSVGEITLRVISGQEFSAIFIEVFDGEAEQIFGNINGPNELDADEELTFRWNNGRWDMDLRPNPAATTAVSIFKPNASGTLARTEDFAAPPAIGNTTAAAATFTTLTANTSLTLNGTGAAELINAGAAAGPLRIYNTFTSATNHERGFLRWSSNVFQIGTEAGSDSGTVRDIQIRAGTSTLAEFTASSGNMTLLAGSIITFAGRARIRDGGTGCVLLQFPFSADFDRLMFGGNSSSFPALKRSSTTLQVRLADDTAFAPLSCGALTINGNLDASTRDIVTDTTTGTKIGTATTQKIGFFNATPVVQQAAVADATNGQSTQDRLNDLLARLRTLGLIAT